MMYGDGDFTQARSLEDIQMYKVSVLLKVNEGYPSLCHPQFYSSVDSEKIFFGENHIGKTSIRFLYLRFKLIRLPAKEFGAGAGECGDGENERGERGAGVGFSLSEISSVTRSLIASWESNFKWWIFTVLLSGRSQREPANATFQICRRCPFGQG